MNKNIQLQKILEHWELGNPNLYACLKEDDGRVIIKIKADSGSYILKVFPNEVPEATIKSNVTAHLFLGNGKGLAPKIFSMKSGDYYSFDQEHWFYLMEYIQGRQMEETAEDEYKIGQATRILHNLNGYSSKSPLNQAKERFYHWFRECDFVKEFDTILDEIPDFEKLDQCFVHTDIGPHNTMLREAGQVVFIDLDDAGIGSRYLDLGWPFIMQFVDYDHDTEEMNYRFTLAESFIRGYYGEEGINREEFDLLFYGAEQMHISYMQTYGPYAVDSLWKILKFGIDQKEKLWARVNNCSGMHFDKCKQFL